MPRFSLVLALIADLPDLSNLGSVRQLGNQLRGHLFFRKKARIQTWLVIQSRLVWPSLVTQHELRRSIESFLVVAR
jgi:hypothetical protein